jgi:hypothetical protein
MRTSMISILVTAFLAISPAAMAQGNATIDKGYEAAKTAELESVKLQLSTSSGGAALAELTEAESALRRLKETRAPDMRRKIATELESALTRLRLEADSAGMRK